MRKLLGTFVFLLLACSNLVAQHEHGGSLVENNPDSPRSTNHQEGLHVNPVPSYAILGATVHRSPTEQPRVETVVIRHGKIVDMGVEVDLPVGAKVIDLTGKHLYAGLMDAFVEEEFEFKTEEGTGYWNDNIRSQLKVSDQFSASELPFEAMRSAGFTAALVAPADGILKGQSSVIMFGDANNEKALLAADVAQHVRLTVSRGRSSGYPNSPMGAYALARQSLYDAQWYQQAWETAQANSTVPKPEANSALEALAPALTGQQMVLIDASNELFALRADRFAREFGLNAVVVGSGNEYRRLSEFARTGRKLIVPVNFPKAPDVSSPDLARDVSLESMMHWDHAPENPARLAANDIEFVFTSKGLESKSEFLKQVRKAVARGLAPETALHAMTSGVAELYGIDHLVGTLEKGKIANITITDGDLFVDETKISGVCVDGQLYMKDHAHLRQVAGRWRLKGKGVAGKTLVLKEEDKKLSGFLTDSRDGSSGEDAEDAEEIQVKSLKLTGTRLTGTFDSESMGQDGYSMFSLLFADEDAGLGQLTLPNGTISSFTAAPEDEWDKVVNGHQHGKPAKNDSAKNDSAKKRVKKKGRNSIGKTSNQPEKNAKLPKFTADATFPVNYPLGAYGRLQAPEQYGSLLIKNVTVWTLDERGKIEDGAVLISGGKIEQVFESNQDLPEAAKVIDGNGGHLTPGLIDCHSHMASDSGINESGQAITAEVRIGDMIDCDDITIYRQLGGGTTMANVLHGSANPIGGQNQVIKLRWGANEEQMKFQGAPAGIKFALGENVKQSNWSNPTNRYPQTRMGVEQLIDDAFRAAKDYQAQWDRWNEHRIGLPPRRDLELEALAEIVKGDRWVHCHSYRQDEILALIRTLDSHGITIGSFQHILEGYKVADAMQKHGAMASAFADWWAYKYEVKDAIPYAGALMHQAGVVVSFNSDDRELGRRLNHEAVKAVRYGGVPEVEALKFVTLNPARQLRIDDRVGSIETGKDADVVLWSGSPLSNLSIVQQTWVDGRKYFDRDADVRAQQQNQSMRVTLIQKILASGEDMVKPNKSMTDPAELWPRHDEFCHDHDSHAAGSFLYHGGQE